MQPFAAPTIASSVNSGFAEDVAAWLSRTPRRIPSEYLYDALGSTLFDAISRLPWYPITRAEQDLLRVHAQGIVSVLQPIRAIVELGPGSGAKLATLVGALPPADPVDVHLVDVSSSALDEASRALSAHDSIRVVRHLAIYEDGLSEALFERRGTGRALVLFLGSNIGNFDEGDAQAFLRRVRGRLAPGDGLLLGADLVKPEREMLLAYDDPLGVTAAFNRNLLVRANRELGANFDLDGFAHRAVWNAAMSRIEMHLVSARRQQVSIPACDLDVAFEAGETIWTESSHKYDSEGIDAMLACAGFRTAAQWEREGFALTLAEAV